MKIIQVDNFDRDDYDDVLIASNVHTIYGNFIVEALNERYSTTQSPHFFRLVEDNFELKVFKP